MTVKELLRKLNIKIKEVNNEYGAKITGFAGAYSKEYIDELLKQNTSRFLPCDDRVYTCAYGVFFKEKYGWAYLNHKGGILCMSYLTTSDGEYLIAYQEGDGISTFLLADKNGGENGSSTSV